MEPSSDGSVARPKRRPRKPRGRGLRTRTGCFTCRMRHKKCDDRRPVCGPCAIGSRACSFPQTDDSGSPASAATPAPREHVFVPYTPAAAANGPVPGAAPPQPPPQSSLSPAAATEDPRPAAQQPPPLLAARQPVGQPGSSSPGMALQGSSCAAAVNAISPETVASELWTTDLASTRWLSLLAADAANADSSFSLAPSPARTPAPSVWDRGSDVDPQNQHQHQQHQQQQQQHQHPNARPPLSPAPGVPDSGLFYQGAPRAEDRRAWQLDQDFILSDHEADLFRHFTENMACWLELLDPSMPFSTHAVRLALRNTGVMKSILALASKHRLVTRHHPGAGDPATTPGSAHHGSSAGHAEDGADESIQYYYETLHYVQEALAYNSYTQSEELVVTAIAISSYEMLDEADGRGNWQRHLKGVFWIQRSQNTDGECGGLRQAVWWSWITQDIWAAFREKRRCLTIWQPKLRVQDLDQHQLARRTIFLLARAVNCCANDADVQQQQPRSHSSSQRAMAPEHLLAEMEELRAHWGEQFRPLPTRAPEAGAAFRPLWIRPPQFGVAVQAYSFAQILVALHGSSSAAPSRGGGGGGGPGARGFGFGGYLRMQKILSEAVNTICGVAMEMTEPACQIMSAQCLYGAGLCVQDRHKREAVLGLMRDCERRVGWTPIATWREDLVREWAKVDNEMG